MEWEGLGELERVKGVIWGLWGSTRVTHGGRGTTETPKSTWGGHWDDLGGAGLSAPQTWGWGRNGSPKDMVEAMAEPPKNNSGGQQWGTFEGSMGGFTWGTLPKEPSKGKIMGGAGVNPLKTTLGGSPLLWKHPKVHWESPGWVREHRRVLSVGGPHAGPPFIRSGGAGPP